MKIRPRYVARWTTKAEQRAYNNANGIVEDINLGGIACVASPMAMAERIAAALNVTNKFGNDELKRMSAALEGEGS